MTTMLSTLKTRRATITATALGMMVTAGYMGNVIVDLHREQAAMHKEQASLRAQVSQLMSLQSSAVASVVQRPARKAAEDVVEPLPQLAFASAYPLMGQMAAQSTSPPAVPFVGQVAAQSTSSPATMSAGQVAAQSTSPPIAPFVGQVAAQSTWPPVATSVGRSAAHSTSPPTEPLPKAPQVRGATKLPKRIADWIAAREAGQAAPRQLDGLMSVGTSLGVGCFQVDASPIQSYDVSGANCNSMNCPTCFITPTNLITAITITISSCSSARWGAGTGTTTRSGAWSYTFINRASTQSMTVQDHGAAHSYTVAPQSYVTAHCVSTAGTADYLYFPSTTLPELTVEGAATTNSLDVTTTSTLTGDITAGDDLTFSANYGISMQGTITMAGSGNFAMTSSGTFSTGSGTHTLGGDVTVAANSGLSLSGTGGVSIGGSGTFTMGTGAFTSGSGANQLSGTVELASNTGVSLSGGGGIDIQGSGSLTMGTGSFTSGSGANTLAGDVSISSTKFLDSPDLKLSSASITCGYTDKINGETVPTDGQNLCTDSGR